MTSECGVCFENCKCYNNCKCCNFDICINCIDRIAGDVLNITSENLSYSFKCPCCRTDNDVNLEICDDTKKIIMKRLVNNTELLTLRKDRDRLRNLYIDLQFEVGDYVCQLAKVEPLHESIIKDAERWNKFQEFVSINNPKFNSYRYDNKKTKKQYFDLQFLFDIARNRVFG